MGDISAVDSARGGAAFVLVADAAMAEEGEALDGGVQGEGVREADASEEGERAALAPPPAALLAATATTATDSPSFHAHPPPPPSAWEVRGLGAGRGGEEIIAAVERYVGP